MCKPIFHFSTWYSNFFTGWGSTQDTTLLTVCTGFFACIGVFDTLSCQTLDSAMHPINHYPADKYSGN